MDSSTTVYFRELLISDSVGFSRNPTPPRDWREHRQTDLDGTLKKFRLAGRIEQRYSSGNEGRVAPSATEPRIAEGATHHEVLGRRSGARPSFEDIYAQFVSQAVSFPMAKPEATAPLHEVRGPISCSREGKLQLRKQRREPAELQMELALAARQRFLKT
jgi:hypothetical protein